MAPAVVRVVLADDEPLVRAGLRTVLEAGGAVRVVGEADDGPALLAQVDRHRPDVVLVDVQMPGGGLAALRTLCARPDAPPAAVLTTFDLDEYVAEALRIGVQGFLLKDAEPDALVRAVLDLAAGGGRPGPPDHRAAAAPARRGARAPAGGADPAGAAGAARARSGGSPTPSSGPGSGSRRPR
jgi:DNA-binding NarL/FixJ family response regulator